MTKISRYLRYYSKCTMTTTSFLIFTCVTESKRLLLLSIRSASGSSYEEESPWEFDRYMIGC